MAAPSAKAVLDAAARADIAALEALAAQGADFNRQYRNYRPIHNLMQADPHHDCAPGAQRLHCLDWLLNHGADPNGDGAWPTARAVLVATWVGERAYADRLIAASATVDGFVQAALGNRAAVTRELKRDPGFATGRDPNGLTALHCACASKLGLRDASVHKAQMAIATALLDAGADQNATVRTWGKDVDAAYFAIGSRRPALLDLLLSRGADPTSALTSAAWNNDPRFRELALRHGANIDAAVSSGKPLLNDLIRWGQMEPALWLLEHGASVHRKDDRGWTALDQAESRGNRRMIEAIRRRV